MKVSFLTITLKGSFCGFSATFTPSGCSIEAMYVLSAGPTLVTILVTLIEPLRFGMVMEGRLRLNKEGFLLEQTDECK